MTTVPAALAAALADRYRLEREVGVGGMATVYLAHDLRHGRPVAVKVLHPDLVSSVGADRFVREIQIAAQLTHPYILPLLDSGEADGKPFYVMPFVEGESLRQRLTRTGPLPVEDALRIALAVAHALEYAHEQGVIHRDIKPENILLARGEPVVADFGIARAVSAAAGDTLTMTGMAIGTPTYMSPEQASGERLVDARSDLYSLAVMLWEMLAGEPPFTGPTAMAITARKTATPPPSVRVLRPAVSEGLDATLRQALAPMPADRFPAVAPFAESLQAALRESLTGESNVPRAGLRRLARRVWQVAGTWRTVALLALASTAFLLLSPRGGPGARGVVNLTLPTGVLSVTGHAPAPVVAVSPDGETIAYVAGAGSSGQLYLRRLSEPEATPVKEAAHAQVPFFSPDGQWLGFVDDSRGSENAVLKKLRLADARQFTICPTKDLHGAAWLPDGRIVLGGMQSNGYGLSIVSSDGGVPEVIAEPDVAKQETYLVYPSALPDGRGVLFTAAGGNGQAISTDVIEVDSRERKLVVAGGGRAVALRDGVLVYAADGALHAGSFDLAKRRLRGRMVQALPGLLMNLPFEPYLGHFAIGGDGTLAFLGGDAGSFRGSQLWWVDADGAVTTALDEARFPQQFGGGPLAITGPRWSPRSDRVVFWSSTPIPDSSGAALFGDVWMVEPRTGVTVKVFPESRYFWPVWSSDGEWVISPRVEDSLNASALFRRRADGRGAPERLTAPIRDRWMMPSDVSRDGALLFYQVTRTAGTFASDIYVLSLTGDRTPRPVLASDASEYGPAISPDGKWLAYAMTEGAGLPQVYVTDFPKLERRWQVSFEGGESPVWHPGGRALFFMLPPAGVPGVDRVSFDPTLDVPAGRPDPFARGPNVSVNVAGAFGRNYDVSPDGRRLLTVGGGSGLGGGEVDTTTVRQLTVILNWASSLGALLEQ
jgi:Tol biopolymer transport system component